MLNYSANSMDGPWFAYNHNGCGLLVKPDAISLASDTKLTNLSPNPGKEYNSNITAAVQVFKGGDIYYFLDNKKYVTVSADGKTTSAPADIDSRWGIDVTSKMQTSGNVNSAFVINGTSYLTLDGQIYEYNDPSFDTLVKEPYPVSQLIGGLPKSWTAIDAAFTATINGKSVSFWFNNASGTVLLRSDTGRTVPIRTSFGLPSSKKKPNSSLSAAAIFNNSLHLIRKDKNTHTYTVYKADGTIDKKKDATVKTLLESVFGNSVTNVSGQSNTVSAMVVIDGGLLIMDALGHRTYVKDGKNVQPLPSPFDSNNFEAPDLNWSSGLSYTDTKGIVHHLNFYNTS